MIDVRRAWREHPRFADAGIVAMAASLTLLVARAGQADIFVYPQLSAGQGSSVDLPLGWAVGHFDGAVPPLVCGLLFWRRRHPVAVTVTLVVLSPLLPVVVPMLVAVFTVAADCSARVTWRLAGVAALPAPAYLLHAPGAVFRAEATAVSGVALVAGAVGWGLFIAGVRERMARAEMEAELRAQQARQRAREEIAREMHDVLAHRLTLLNMHAGALEFRPTLAPAQLAEAAGVIRQSASQALEDLQDVLRVLRAPTISSHADPPQPTLRETARLIEESRAAGATVDVHQQLEDLTTLDAATARTAYRVVQETLTNHRKHAPHTLLRLTLAGGPDTGLTITAANPAQSHVQPKPAASAGASGQGLIGMNERIHLIGGRMRHHHTLDEFRLDVWLPWTR